MLEITYFIYIKYVSIKSFASRVTNLLAPGQPKKTDVLDASCHRC